VKRRETIAVVRRQKRAFNPEKGRKTAKSHKKNACRAGGSATRSDSHRDAKIKSLRHLISTWKERGRNEGGRESSTSGFKGKDSHVLGKDRLRFPRPYDRQEEAKKSNFKLRDAGEERRRQEASKKGRERRRREAPFVHYQRAS